MQINGIEAVELLATASPTDAAAVRNRGRKPVVERTAAQPLTINGIEGVIFGTASSGPGSVIRLDSADPALALAARRRGQRAVVVVNSAGTVVPATPEAPVNTVLPVVSGTLIEGQTLSTTDGTWTGSPAPTYSYQWQADTGGNGTFANIGGATASTYLLTSGEVGDDVRVVVTATNSEGAVSANSAATDTIVAADTTPAAFTFTDVTDATVSTLYTSNTITVTGINASTAVTITGGEYSKNGGAYTSSAGTAVVNDTFAVRHTSSGSNSTATNTILTIGGVSDTYTTTTEAAAGDWWEDSDYDNLAVVADFNNDRYALPLQSDELVLNGTLDTAMTYGSEMVDNGDFSTGGVADPSLGWLLKTPAVGTETMTISGGTLNLTGDGTNSAYADQSFTTIVGAAYELTLTASASSSIVTVGASAGNSSVLNLNPLGAATHTYRFIATVTTTWVRLTRVVAVAGTFDNVSLKEITNYATATQGWIPTSAAALPSVSSNRLRITNNTATNTSADTRIPVIMGQTYKVTYTHYGRNGGTGPSTYSVINSAAGSVVGATTAASPGAGLSNTIEFYFTATETASHALRLSVLGTTQGDYMEADNISVKEVMTIPGTRSLGSELVTDGAFASGISGWSIASTPGVGTISHEAGRLRLTNVGGASATRAIYTLSGLTVGGMYQFSLDTFSLNAGAVNLGVGLLATGVTTGQVLSASLALGGSYKSHFTATQTTHYLIVYNTTTTAGLYNEIDNVSVKLLTTTLDGRTYGSELVTNGVFAADTDWTKGTDWTIASGVATKVAGAGSSLQQVITLTADTPYEVTYTITRTAGSVAPRFTGGTNVAGISRSASGTYTETLLAVSGNNIFAFLADTSFAGTVDNVSVKAVTALGTYPKREATFDECFAFTAASEWGRTYTDSGGQLLSMDYGRTNLIWPSEDLSHANWTKTTATITADAAVAPDGTTTADKLVEDNTTAEHRVTLATSGGTTTIGRAYTKSFYAKAAERTRLRIYTSALNNHIVFINLGDGTSYSASGGTSPSVSVTAAANGFYKISVTDVATSTTVRPQINLVSTGTTVNYLGDNASGLFLWGFQLEPQTTTSTYIPTTTAAIQGGVNARRMTYANAKQQLRLENAGTNLITYSQGFTNAAWGGSQMTAAAAVGEWFPIRETAVTNFHRFQRTGQSVTSGTAYTFSARVKKVGRRYVGMRGDVRAVGTATEQVMFDLDTTTVQWAATGWTGAIKSNSDGSFDISVTTTATASSNAAIGFVTSDAAIADNTIPSFAGDTAQGFDIRHAQFEASAFATDYIPTTSASAIRFIETCRMSPLVEAILQRTAGSVVTRLALTNTDTSVSRRIVGGDTTTALAMLGASSGTNIQIWNGTNSVTGALPSGNAYSAFGTASGFDAAGRSIVSNGGTVGSDANAPGGRTNVYLGRDTTNAAKTFGDGYYDFLGVSPERLPDANLQALAVAAP